MGYYFFVKRKPKARPRVPGSLQRGIKKLIQGAKIDGVRQPI